MSKRSQQRRAGKNVPGRGTRALIMVTVFGSTPHPTSPGAQPSPLPNLHLQPCALHRNDKGKEGPGLPWPWAGVLEARHRYPGVWSAM